MQRIAIMLGLGLLIAAGIWLSGCGTSDLLDEKGQRYQANIQILDLDEATTGVDVVQDFCDTDVEDYGPATVAVEFALSEDAPGITLVGYTLEYIPLESADGNDQIVMPPDLESPLRGGNLGIDIPAGGSAEFEITCISVDTKEEYRRNIGWLYKHETPNGQAELEELAATIDEVEAEIESIQEDIYTETQAGNDDQVERLEALLDNRLERLDSLLLQYQTDYWAFYIDVSNPLYTLDEGRYKIRITFEFEDEYGQSRTVVREDTVWLGNFDNC